MFLQNLPLEDLEGLGVVSGLAGLVLGFLALFLVFSLALYVYLSFVYFAIAKKARLRTPGLAWIPLFGPLIVAYQTSKMHWWPWLLLIGYMIPFIGVFTGIVFAVYIIMWHWKMFESVRKPGWWALLMLIPIVGFVMLGVAAWSKK